MDYELLGYDIVPARRANDLDDDLHIHGAGTLRIHRSIVHDKGSVIQRIGDRAYEVKPVYDTTLPVHETTSGLQPKSFYAVRLAQEEQARF